jgi:hypothetical protein
LSSILKALKKLEDESPALVDDPSWLQSVDEKESGFEHLKDHFITYQRIYSTFAILLLVLAVGAVLNLKLGIVKRTPVPLIYAKKQAGTATPVTSLQNEPPALPDVKPAGRMKRQLPETRPKEPPRLLTERPEKKEGLDILSKKVDKPPSPALETLAVESRKPARHLLATTSSKALSNSKSEIDTHAPEKDSALQPLRSSDPGQFADAEILDDPNIKLQAISWSENTEKRLAVVNSKIVRSGSRVGSYIVFQINQDDVIVRQGEELRKILFRPR